MFKNIINFSSNLGQCKSGVEKSPYIINKFLENQFINKINIPITDNLINNIENLYYYNKSISDKKINLGGDHSMSIATLADSLNRYNNIKVIWIDAHCDINTYKSSPSKNYHGMPLSILSGIDKESRKDFKFLNNIPYFNLKNLLYLGIRDIDPFEKVILEKYDIEYINVYEINNFPCNCLNKIENFIEDNPVHLSFDVDSIDRIYIPCTGTPSNLHGINMNAALILFENFRYYNIVSADITELNLRIGNYKDKVLSINNTVSLLNKLII